MRARYHTYGDTQLQKSIRTEVDKYRDHLYAHVEKDCTYQAIAVVMAVLHRSYGFGGKRLQKLKNEVEDEYMLMMQNAMGSEYSPRDCQKWLKETYNIDFEVSRYDG